jgi:hypothetical protein
MSEKFPTVGHSCLVDFKKQVVTMFFSACGPGLQEKKPDLVRSVLDRDMQQLPRNF